MPRCIEYIYMQSNICLYTHQYKHWDIIVIIYLKEEFN